MQPKVVNKSKLPDDLTSENAVFIGRPTKWGNPFVVDLHGNRKDCVRMYEDWIATNLDLLNDLHELKGKYLVCWCAPKSCHGDVLLRLANG